MSTTARSLPLSLHCTAAHLQSPQQLGLILSFYLAFLHCSSSVSLSLSCKLLLTMEGWTVFSLPGCLVVASAPNSHMHGEGETFCQILRTKRFSAQVYIEYLFFVMLQKKKFLYFIAPPSTSETQPMPLNCEARYHQT